MLGTRKEFEYWECLQCGYLQVVETPADLADYYPRSYYSFSVHASGWKRWYYRAHFASPAFMKRLRRCSADISAVIAAKVSKGAKILDVGSGAGRLVEILRALGFDAYGIDPYIAFEGGYVRRASLEEENGKWDLIMFNHSLEHMQDHIEALRCACGKLSTGGTCLVRIPIAAWAWEHYGRDWVQLDVPRHLGIHTLKSFRLTAEAAGFEVVKVVFDSNEFQFYASEQYKRDLPLFDERAKGLFSQKDLKKFRAMADKLNAEQTGDQAAFFLTSSQ
jgi:SAM-dependent methyltransferase